MAGLLAWAADVVGGGGIDSDGGDALSRIPVLFSPEQQRYVWELDQKAASLARLIQDLRQRLPPPDISQSLPHLHAHTLASNAALALQLNAHSTTREQAQLREATLQEENADFERAISNCESKIQEKMQEADSLQRKLEEMDETEKKLKAELDNLKRQNSVDTDQSVRSHGWKEESNTKPEAGPDTDASDSAILNKLEEKNKELSLMEEIVQKLEKKWAEMQESALKHPSPAQREKTLDKQLHSLIEQLAAKQTQAEGLLSEIHLKEMELERLNGQWRRMESNITEANTTRNRFVRSSSDKGHAPFDYDGDGHQKLPYHSGGRNESQQKIMLLRSAFVLYILALHVIVFIKISF
ncbi:uncharacterized protein LOC129293249 isoform X2 [Prosopis cineraria]|uniref:uncharacterized protein LOC129293249 isoform X2 n=1 Tax=Prosopis cineraria TaxID=364024 RepID=UPI00240F2FB4|nr:uncharacterized protein LOC129293249 isoform X2 [Prosopis cineraria]